MRGISVAAMRKRIAAFLILLSAVSFVAHAQELTRDANRKQLMDIVYGTAAGVDMKMDIAMPAGEGPFPAVLYVHGGGWKGGDKSDGAMFATVLAAGGYVAASANYRMIPEHKWPAQLEDIKCAIRYLRAHARELKIDPNTIGLVGHSAGGHVALMAALVDASEGFEGSGGNADQSSRVQAVVDMSGPTDLRTWKYRPEIAKLFVKEFGGDGDQLLAWLLGTSDRTAVVMADASPVTHANAGDPPVLILHGDMDPVVPIEQARVLADALQKAGVEYKLVILDGDHGLSGEAGMKAALEIQAFFAMHLKGGVGGPSASAAAPSEGPD